MVKRSKPVLGVLLGVLLAACDPGAPAAADAGAAADCGLIVTLEVRRPDGVYVPLAAAADAVDASLVQGFQGFRYLYLRARFDRDPGSATAAVQLQLDGATPRSQPLADLDARPDPGGVVSAPQRVFFNDDPLPSLVDRGCALTLRVGGVCAASGRAVLRYDPSCVEGPDGDPICADAGVAADGAP